MAAQKRSLHRNYIDLIEDEDGDRRAAESQLSADRPIKDYLRGLIAAMRTGRGPLTPSPVSPRSEVALRADVEAAEQRAIRTAPPQLRGWPRHDLRQQS